MNSVEQSPSFNISVASSQFDSNDDMHKANVKNHVKDLLKSRIFLARYVERRLINQRIGYRDIVVLSAAEVELKKDLIEVQNKLHSICPNIWIGITNTDFLEGNVTPGVCLSTEIDNQPFGPFWFQIRSVKFRDDEVIVALKCLRHISDNFLEIEPILTGAAVKKNKETSNNNTNNDIVSLNETYKEIVGNLRTALSITNVKEFFTFLFAFLIAIVTGSTAFINFLGNFILALIREMSILIKNSTPMFLGFLDFLSKIVGGFYILLAMFFKPSNPPPSNKRTISHYSPSYSQNTHADYSRDFD